MRHLRSVIRLALCGLFLLGQACGSSGGGGAQGTGGQPGSAGATGAGGTTGAGGATGAAGMTGAGGTTGAGGSAGVAGGTGGAGGSPTGQGGSGMGGRGGAGVGGAIGTGGAPSDGGVSDGARDGVGDGGVAYMPCPTTAGTACAVLPLGDSITEGCCTAPYGGYRIELFRQAGTNRKNITFVGSRMNGPPTVDGRNFPPNHDGWGGYTISGGGQGPIAGTITDSALSNYHPHIVLLMIGTNDINGNIDIANAPTRLAALIDDILTRAPSTLLVVSTIVPTGNDNTNVRVQSYNASMRTLVNMRATAGKHIMLVDNYPQFTQNPNYKTALMVPDGLHPNDAGYVVLGRSFYGAISAFLQPGP